MLIYGNSLVQIVNITNMEHGAYQSAPYTYFELKFVRLGIEAGKYKFINWNGEAELVKQEN
jgi:hypothetical protein